MEELKHTKTIEAIDYKIKQINAIVVSPINDFVAIQDEDSRQMGFVANMKSQEDIVKALYADGAIGRGDKLTPKNKIIDKNNRKEDEQIRAIYSELVESGAIEVYPIKGLLRQSRL